MNLRSHFWLAALLVGMPIPAPARPTDEIIYHGRWEGVSVALRLRVSETTGAVSGLVFPPENPDAIIAAIQGKRLPDGSLVLELNYRFESLGRYVLKPSGTGPKLVWQTDLKDLWFGLSPVPPRPEPLETDGDRAEKSGK